MILLRNIYLFGCMGLNCGTLRCTDSFFAECRISGCDMQTPSCRVQTWLLYVFCIARQSLNHQGSPLNMILRCNIFQCC